MRKIILFNFLFSCTICFAQEGALDPAFGSQGIVKTRVGSAFNYSNFGEQVLVQPDGSMFLVFHTAGMFQEYHVPGPLDLTGPTLITKKHADGSTDLSYGDNGFSSSVPIYASCAAMQTDGKIVVVGYTLNSELYYNQTDFAIARFNTDGSLDNSFGENGIQVTELIVRDVANSVAIQSDGKIVVAGNTDQFSGYDSPTFLALVRYNTDGSLDNTFDGDGRLTTSFGEYRNRATSIAVQSDGKIILAGATGNSNFYFALARYNTDGTPDNSFSGDGIQITGIISDFLDDNPIAIQSDGKILVGGSGSANFYLTRFNTDGNFDNSFDGDGIATTGFGAAQQRATSIALQSNGKIILGGYVGNGINNNFALARYNTDGSPDNNFSGDGKQITDFQSGNDYATSIAIQSDGKLVALGYSINGAHTYVVAARYNVNGRLDRSFDGNGKLTYHIRQGFTIYTSTAIQSDGKILAAGYAWNGSNYDFALARYNTNGSLDITFSANGKQMTDFGSDDKANAIAIQSDGKIVVGGSAGDNFGLARYNTDGTLDISFDGDGKQTTGFLSPDSITSIAIQSDGKIIAGGSVIVRYNINGSPDMSFGTAGQLTPAFNCNDIAIQNDGKIVVTGSTGDCMVARYDINGIPDNTFGTDGLQIFYSAVMGASLVGKSIAIQNDGKIVVGGYWEFNYRNTRSIFVLMRLNIGGTIDNTFNGGAIVETFINSKSHANSLLIQSDNKIILAGYTYNGSSDDFTIARYNTDGSLDNTFGSNGIVETRASTAYDRIAGIAISNDKLYAVGYGQYPADFGVIARYTLAEGGPLPVSLLNFNASLQNKSVLLQWKTAGEKNLAKFVIERSGDGTRFLPMKSMTVSGISTLTKDYSITDEQPLQGINFYRLKMVDADGKFTYSNIVAVKINLVNKLVIFPNPADRILFVQASGNDENARIQIVDGAGRIIKELKVFLNGQTSFTIDISNIAKGMYHLILYKKEKREVQTFIRN